MLTADARCIPVRAGLSAAPHVGREITAYLEGTVYGNVAAGGIGEIENRPVIVVGRVDRGDGEVEHAAGHHADRIPDVVSFACRKAGDQGVDFIGQLSFPAVRIGLEI